MCLLAVPIPHLFTQYGFWFVFFALGPVRNSRIFVYFIKKKKHLSSVPMRAVFVNIVKPRTNFKSAVVLPRSSRIFAKRQNCHILKFADVILTESVNQRILILLFSVCTFSRRPPNQAIYEDGERSFLRHYDRYLKMFTKMKSPRA